MRSLIKISTEELFGFHARPLLVELECGNVVFLWKEEKRRTGRKTLGTKQDPIKKLNPYVTGTE